MHTVMSNAFFSIGTFQKVDTVFDIFNSRNLHCSGFKRPTCQSNWLEVTEKLQSKKHYLYSLKGSDGTPIHAT